MATTYSDYSLGGNEFYGDFYGYSQPSVYDSSNYYANCTSNSNVGHFNDDHNVAAAINQNNNNDHYQAQSNWPTQTAITNNNNSHHQQQRQQYYPTNTTQQYANDPYQHQQQQSQQQQYQSPRFASTTYNGGQLNMNEHYPESPKHTEGYQSNCAPAIPVPKPIENRPKETSTGPLRALLSNKSMRYSPIYAKRDAIVPARKMENVSLSPIKGDDSLDLLDDFAYAKRQSIDGAIHKKLGYESKSVPSSFGAMHSPTMMTSENMMASEIHSPMTRFVDGIGTPPLSPNEAAIEQQTHVNQMPTNMIDDTWTKTSSECKYF